MNKIIIDADLHIFFKVVASSMEVRCKCHGMSGSCEMKTCWKATPDFRRIGTVLKQRFDGAVLVDQTQIGNRVSSPNRWVIQTADRTIFNLKTIHQSGIPEYSAQFSMCGSPCDIIG